MSGDSRFSLLILIESREGIVCFQKLKAYVCSKKRWPQGASNV